MSIQTRAKGAHPNVAISSLIYPLHKGHMIFRRGQIFPYLARLPVFLRCRDVNEGDGGRALEVENGGRVGIGPGERGACT
jgi:hypothetical protein